MNDIEYFRKRFHVFYDFMIKIQGPVFFTEQLKSVFDTAYDKADIKKLKAINKELDVLYKQMFDKESQRELAALLEKELNEKIEDKGNLKKIDQIIKRGSIKNNKEYELLLNRVEEIFSDKDKKKEVLLINKLLADYHKR